jgi:dethiobiotin synthetase
LLETELTSLPPAPDWQALIASLPSPKVLFVCGTDTDVGKTWITTQIARAALQAASKVHLIKPVQTGVLPNQPGDVETILTALGAPSGLSGQTLYRFEPPAAPWPADVEGLLKADALILQIRQAIKADGLTLIEGAGGLRVPITKSLDMLGLIEALRVPTVLVTRPNLGTINHTRLSCDALVEAKISCLGVVVNQGVVATPLCDESGDAFAQRTLPTVLQSYLPVGVLGFVKSECL